jgi:hypothetical protein
MTETATRIEGFQGRVLRRGDAEFQTRRAASGTAPSTAAPS